MQNIIELLNRAYADEWLAYYQYFIEAKVVRGIMRDSAVKELEEHAKDELRHANMVADRIIQLGGTPILNPTEWFAQSNCGYIEPSNFDIVQILEDSIKGEQCAINVYTQLVDLSHETNDIVTHKIVTEILADEVEHEHDLITLRDDVVGFVAQLRQKFETQPTRTTTPLFLNRLVQ